jgi:uncharacterized membrane-anchored protein
MLFCLSSFLSLVCGTYYILNIIIKCFLHALHPLAVFVVGRATLCHRWWLKKKIHYVVQKSTEYAKCYDTVND